MNLEKLLTGGLGPLESDEIKRLERRRGELLLIMLQHDEEKDSDSFRLDRMEEELREIDRRLEALRRSGAEQLEESRRRDEEDLLRQERIR